VAVRYEHRRTPPRPTASTRAADRALLDLVLGRKPAEEPTPADPEELP
jgi:hypothetical protein